jgi:hypothetical protein
MYNIIWVLLAITAAATIWLSYLDPARVYVG